MGMQAAGTAVMQVQLHTTCMSAFASSLTPAPLHSSVLPLQLPRPAICGAGAVGPRARPARLAGQRWRGRLHTGAGAGPADGGHLHCEFGRCWLALGKLFALAGQCGGGRLNPSAGPGPADGGHLHCEFWALLSVEAGGLPLSVEAAGCFWGCCHCAFWG